MNRTRLAALICIALGMLVITARFGVQPGNVAVPPSSFESTAMTVRVEATAHARRAPNATSTPQPASTPLAHPTPKAAATAVAPRSIPLTPVQEADARHKIGHE